MLTPHTVQVVDFEDILSELFGDDTDVDTIDAESAVIDYLCASNEWTFGDTPYTLVDSDAFIEFLRDCVNNEVTPSLTTEKVDAIQAAIPVEVYVNLEGL